MDLCLQERQEAQNQEWPEEPSAVVRPFLEETVVGVVVVVIFEVRLYLLRWIGTS